MDRRLSTHALDMWRLRAAIAASPIVVRQLAVRANVRISSLIADWRTSSVALRSVESADIEVLDWIVGHARRPQPVTRVLM
jgi:hypothetical protein